MSAEHTPGPWAVDQSPEDDNRLGIVSQQRIDRGLIPIAMVSIGYSERMEREQRANAQLIAAAPDLLAALKDILDVVAVCFDDFGNTTTEICQASDFSAARAAIAKATAP